MISSFGEYKTNREKLVEVEKELWLGSSNILSEKEQKVNKILMNYKLDELNQAYVHPEKYLPAMSFFKSKPFVEQSEVFKIIKQLPKGGSLHSHDTAMASLDYVRGLMDTDNLYGCINKYNRLELKVFYRQPDSTCDWKLIKDMRSGDKEFDAFLEKQLSIIEPNPEVAYPDINAVWTRFIETFMTVNGVICFKPVFERYFYQVLKELHEDNVKYVEFRGLLPEVYDEENRVYGPMEVLSMYHDVWTQFRADYPDFYGCKFIYAPLRLCDNETALYHINLTISMKEMFPDFLAGFDLVGQEDLGRPLIDFAPEIFKLSKKVDVFFHAAETNWNCSDTDMNIIDAVLMNTKRIGHGYGVLRHPAVLELIEKKNIAVEVCPISNQVLKLVNDLRNHPGSVLINRGTPMVICCDDPGMWGSKGLSYDWYMAFMGLAPRHADLKFLKQLAQNSLMFTAMSEQEKQAALGSWVIEWNEFLSNILKTHPTN